MTASTIRKLRARLGLSQAAFAREVGASSASVINRWEKGTHRPHHLYERAMRKLEAK